MKKIFCLYYTSELFHFYYFIRVSEITSKSTTETAAENWYKIFLYNTKKSENVDNSVTKL